MNQLAHLSDTILALASPPGTGAIAVLRLSGKEAINIAKAVFRGKDLGAQPSHTIHFGGIVDEKGALVDEVLVSLFKAPHSYTRENVVEISTHGSPYIVQRVLALLTAKGARLAAPGEFTMRAFLNGQLDLSQAEAVADLIAASSAASHDLALRQMRGGFSNEIKRLRQALIDFAALIELELDFGEEDVEFADRADLKKLIAQITNTLTHLIQSFELGNVLKNGVRTVIAGRPNAGKSTLLNALLNEERAIVSAEAGTTRDTIEEVLNIGGIAFRLTDTAGIREAQNEIESIGIQKTWEKVRQAAILLYLFDLSAPTALTDVASDLARLEREGLRTVVVANKIDRLATLPTLPEGWLALSAKSGTGLNELRDQLLQAATKDALPEQSTIVSNARHQDALLKARQALGTALHGLERGTSTDFVALDIRTALHHLGSITGDISSEDLLDSIFSKFCIGK
jgi:tRNA modification GTPase